MLWKLSSTPGSETHGYVAINLHQSKAVFITTLYACVDSKISSALWLSTRPKCRAWTGLKDLDCDNFDDLLCLWWCSAQLHVLTVLIYKHQCVYFRFWNALEQNPWIWQLQMMQKTPAGPRSSCLRKPRNAHECPTWFKNHCLTQSNYVCTKSRSQNKRSQKCWKAKGNIQDSDTQNVQKADIYLVPTLVLKNFVCQKSWTQHWPWLLTQDVIWH